MLALTDPQGNAGVGSWPARRARMAPETVALSQAGLELTFAALAHRTARLAAALVRRGVTPGARVAYLGANDLTTFETFFACGWLGAIFVPLNYRLAPTEVAYMVADSGAEVLVVGRDVSDLASAVLTISPSLRHVVHVDPATASGGEAYDALLDAEPARTAEVSLDDPALLLYTSGTTGRPKAATLTHGNLTWNMVNQLGHVDARSDDRALCTAPLFHAVGLGQVTLPTLFKGGTVEVHSRFDAGAVLAAVEDGATCFSAVPTMLQLIAEHPRWSAADLSSLRYVVYGGSAVSERVARAWLDRGVRIQHGYGMTEAGPGILMSLADGADQHPVSVGVPHFFTDVAVRQENGSPGRLAPGAPAGELLVGGPHVFAGYWNRPAETAEVFDDTWLRTGDVVRVEADGWAYVVDRVKDLIISGGENIYPAEVEAALAEIDGVRSAAVVARPDARWGEVGVAFLELTPGTHLTYEQIRTHLEPRLAKYKIPREVHVVDELPRNATGKVRRIELRDAVGPDPEETS